VALLTSWQINPAVRGRLFDWREACALAGRAIIFNDNCFQSFQGNSSPNEKAAGIIELRAAGFPL
jgi:hypothetical protein